MLAYYKGLLIAGLKYTATYLMGNEIPTMGQPILETNSSQQRSLIYYEECTYTELKNAPRELEPIAVWNGSEHEAEDAPKFYIIEDAEEVDDTFDPPIMDDDEDDIGTTEISGVPIPRSLPVPIIRKSRETTHRSGMQITESEVSRLLKSGYLRIFMDYKIKAKLYSRVELFADIIPVVFDDGSLFFFDSETVTLLPESDFTAFYLRAVSHLTHQFLSSMDYHIRDVEWMKAKSMFRAVTMRGHPNAKILKDLDIPLSSTGYPTQAHPVYGPLHILMHAREKAFIAGEMTIEKELAKKKDMNFVRFNRLMREYAEEPVEVREQRLAVNERMANEQRAAQLAEKEARLMREVEEDEDLQSNDSGFDSIYDNTVFITHGELNDASLYF